MFVVTLGPGLEVPVRHGQHQDGLDLNGLGVPGVGEDDAGVGVGREEDLEQLPEQLLAQQRDRRVDLQQPQHQHVRTRLPGEGKQLGNLGGCY